MNINSLKKTLIPLSLTIVLLSVSYQTYSQQSNTLYFMRGVPQIYQINPAFQPECNFFIGFPGIAPLQMRVENSSFALNDVLIYNDELDSLITFLHPLADKGYFLSLLKDRNHLNTELSTSIGSMGFRVKNSYLSFDIATRGNVRFTYPADLLKFPINGPDSDMNYDFNGLAINSTVWNEFAIGYSLKISQNLSVGWRGKLLIGAFNMQMKKFDVLLSTGEDEWDLKSDILLNTSVPFLDVVYDEEGMIDFDSTELREFPESLLPVLLNPKNMGLAMDIGIDYRPTEWLQVSASLTDFGSINWRDRVHNLENNTEYNFKGFEINPGDDDDVLQIMADSFEQEFKYSATQNSYRTWLPSKFYAGASFYPHPKINFGILSRTEFLQGDIRQQFTLSANFYPLRMLSAAFSYSVLEGYYKNLGFGLSLKPGPFNFYIVTDTGPSAALWPYETRFINLRMGLNLTFGCIKEKKKPKFDMPSCP